MVLLLLNDPVEDVEAGRIAERLELPAIFGNVAAFINFQAAQGKIVAADAGFEAAGVAGGFAAIDRLRGSQLPQARGP